MYLIILNFKFLLLFLFLLNLFKADRECNNKIVSKLIIEIISSIIKIIFKNKYDKFWVILERIYYIYIRKMIRRKIFIKTKNEKRKRKATLFSFSNFCFLSHIYLSLKFKNLNEKLLNQVILNLLKLIIIKSQNVGRRNNEYKASSFSYIE